MFPTTVDDISSAAKMEEIAVTYFNAAGHTTVAGGTVHPRGTVLLSSNKSFVESDRYVCFIAVHGVWFNSLPSMVFTQAILSPHCAFRNASRMVHIPFFRPETEVTEAEKRDAEENLRAARMTASSSVGKLIAIGQHFSIALVQECMLLTTSSMPKMGYRANKSYATVLAFAKLVRYNL